MQNKKLEQSSKEIWLLCRALEGLPLKKLKNTIKKHTSSEPVLWIKLFSQIRFLRNYSKSKLLEKLDQPLPKELRIAERTLLKNIRIALNTKPLPSPRSKVSLLLKSAEEFYLRGFPLLAQREISRANKICNDFEMLEEQHAVLEWALKIAMDLESWNEVEKILQLNSLLIQKSTELHGFKQHLIDYWQEEVSARTKLDKHINHFLPPGLSIRARLHHLLLLGTGYMSETPDSEKYTFLAQAIQLLESQPNIRLSNPTLSIEIFRRWFQCCLFNGFHEILVEWLENVKSITFLSPSQNQRLHELTLIWKLETNLKMQSKDLDHSAEMVKQVFSQRKRSQWTRRHYEMAIALARYSLHTSEYKAVLLLLRQVMESAKTSTIGKRYLLEAKHIEIEVHQKMGNLDVVQNKRTNLEKINK